MEQLETPDAEGRIVRLTVDLQQDFALNQPLSTFALAAFDLLDAESPSYALDMVSVVESTLDDPRQILAAQQNKARGEAVGQMKADGVEYEERMERLQEVTYPKPLSELLWHAYDVYRTSHPWVNDHPVSPKSVIRDMFERAMTFTEFTSHYELARTEGIVLRYLASAYKALEHTIPDDVKSEDLQDLISWLGEMVRQVDSSLLDEWEQLANPEVETAEQAQEKADEVKPVTANTRAFRVLVRNAMFRRVELAALDRAGCPGRAGRRRRVGRGRVGRCPGRVLGRARGDRHRSGRARPEAAEDRGGPGARAVAGLAGVRRPGGRSRLGHQGRGGPRRVRRGGPGDRPRHRRRPAVRTPLRREWRGTA